MKTYFEYDLAIAILESTIESDIAEYEEMEEDSILESIGLDFLLESEEGEDKEPSKKQGKLKEIISKMISLIKTFFKKIKDRIKSFFNQKSSKNASKIISKIESIELTPEFYESIANTEIAFRWEDLLTAISSTTEDFSIINKEIDKFIDSYHERKDNDKYYNKPKFITGEEFMNKYNHAISNHKKLTNAISAIESKFIKKLENLEDPNKIKEITEAKSKLFKIVSEVVSRNERNIQSLTVKMNQLLNKQGKETSEDN